MQPGSPPRPGSRPQIGIGGCRIGPRAKALVAEVLDSNRLSAGPMTERFEREIAALHGASYGLFCGSGTSALQIALAAFKEREGWAEGDEVLDGYCIDPARIEERITPRTRAVMPVHVGGCPARWTRSWRSRSAGGCAWLRTAPRPCSRATGAPPWARGATWPASPPTSRT